MTNDQSGPAPLAVAETGPLAFKESEMPFDGTNYGEKTVAEKMLAYFEGGRKWHKWHYVGHNGNRCVMSALYGALTGEDNGEISRLFRNQNLRNEFAAFAPAQLLLQAIREVTRVHYEQPEQFNDDQRTSWGDVLHVLIRMDHLERDARREKVAEPVPPREPKKKGKIPSFLLEDA